MQRARGLPIAFLGFLANNSEEFRQYLAACDVVVIPSRVEPFGYAAIEALAMSAPVIASRTGGLAEIVTADVGLLVPPGDAAALATAIKRLHDEPERVSTFRKNSRARVADLYTVEHLIGRYSALFERSAAAGLRLKEVRKDD